MTDYKKIAKELTQMGFKGEVLDLRVEVAKPQQRLCNEEQLINKIMDEDEINSTGCLFKCGVQIANAGVMTTAGMRKIESIKKKKAQQNEMKMKKEAKSNAEAIAAFNKFIVAPGKNKQIADRDSKAMIKYLLPILAQNEKNYDYNTGPKTLARLKKFGFDLGNNIT